MTETNRQWVLAKRPEGLIEDDTFELRTEPVPDLEDGQFLVRVRYLSFDPAQRGWLNDTRGYVPPVAIGEVMRASAAGKVVASRHPGFAKGDLVSGAFGWQEWALSDGTGLVPVNKLPSGIPPNHALSIYGITGLTAYFGLLDVGQPKQGDVVLVSGAAGATGSVAGQIAKLGGCRVVGIAGGGEKCAWLTGKAGFDAAIDYKSEDLGARLSELCPQGVDVYFDNVGWETLDVVLTHLALRARVVLCGAISSGYTMEQRPGPSNYRMLIAQRARMEGFLILDYVDRFPEAIQALTGWVAAGQIVFEEDVAKGFENAPQTLNRLFMGKNFGKQLLEVAAP